MNKNKKMVLTVNFIEDELISGEVQLSQIQVGDAAVGLAEETDNVKNNWQISPQKT